MASPSLFRNPIRNDLYICARCAVRASTSPGKITRRWIGMKYLAKVADAEFQWEQKAEIIRSGKQKSMLTILEERGLVQTITGTRDAADKMMTDRRLGAYVGIDPTAASLHIGHLIPLMCLFWMYFHGYHTVSLLGGATAKIGDPTDRLTTRETEIPAIRTANMTRMHYQMKKLWLNVEAVGRKRGYIEEWSWHRELVNNNSWWNKQPMLEVLQVLGPGMRLGSMLARDTVKNKMSKGDGMSYAEFSYPLMQAWDWWYMFHTKSIQMQIGGSDQFGNITAGIDAVKYISAHHSDPVVRSAARAIGEPFGFTVPLLTTSSGQKFGKSAGNAIWLDSQMTSSFDLYGYLLRTSDADVGKYLKMFTFLPIHEIDSLVAKHMESPSQRIAQHALAGNFVELVHGVDEAAAAERQHRLIFGKGPTAVDVSSKYPDGNARAAAAGIITHNNKPNTDLKLPRSVIYQKSIGKILYATGLVESASHGHHLANAQGAYIGGKPDQKTKKPMLDGIISWAPIKNWVVEDTSKYLIHNDLLLFRKGKHNVRIVQVVSNEEYALSGESYPGMTQEWRNEVLTAIALKKQVLQGEKEAIKELDENVLITGSDAEAEPEKSATHSA